MFRGDSNFEIEKSNKPADVSAQLEQRIREARETKVETLGDGSYQKHVTDKTGRDVTMRVEGNDPKSIERATNENRLNSAHQIRLRASDTQVAESPPAYKGKGEFGRMNLTLEIDRDQNGIETGRRVRLNDVFVNPGDRNRGVGSAFANEAENIARQHNAKEIYGTLSYESSEEQATREFYRRNGYDFRSAGQGEEIFKRLDENAGDSLRRQLRR
jgi:GNAT superfamily N-acetyltransferase